MPRIVLGQVFISLSVVLILENIVDLGKKPLSRLRALHNLVGTLLRGALGKWFD